MKVPFCAQGRNNPPFIPAMKGGFVRQYTQKGTFMRERGRGATVGG